MFTHVELRLGDRTFGRDEFVIWAVPDSGEVPAEADLAGPADEAALLSGDDRAGEAAAAGAGLLCADPDRALALGVRPDGIIVDAGTAPPAARVAELVAGGRPVCVTAGGPPGEEDPGLLAALSVYAWLGARVFRVAAADVPAARQVLDMVASVKGVRPPAVSRRGLA